MQAEEKKLRVLKTEIEASRHGDSAISSSKVWSSPLGQESMFMIVVVGSVRFHLPTAGHGFLWISPSILQWLSVMSG